jgi:integrase
MSVFKRRRSDGTLSKVYSYYFRFRGRRYSGSTEEVSKERAREVERSRRDELRFGRTNIIRDLTFKELGEEYLRLHASQRKSEPFYRHTVAILDEHFGARMLSTIGARDVQEFLTSRRKAVKTSTANRSLVVLKHMLRLAVEWGYAEANPAAGFKLERELNRREFFLTAEQWEALRQALPTWLRPLALAALHTGARRGELVSLTWEDVDLDRGLVTFRNTKNGEDRVVALSATLAVELRRLPWRLQGGKVFRGFHGEPLKVNSFRGAFEGAVRRAGLAGFRFHDLRHSSASFMVQAGIPLNTVREVLGHKSMSMTLRYAHLAPEHQRDAIAALDRIGAKGDDSCSGTKSSSRQ